MIILPFYAFTDRQVTDICREYSDAKFIPITYPSKNLKEGEYIYSHAVAKFQHLMVL